MKLLYVAGAAIPALVSLTVIVASQYSPPQATEPQAAATPVAVEGDANSGTCDDAAQGEDCEAYLAGRDGDLSPVEAPLGSNIDPGDLLDQLIQQTAGFETPGFQDGLSPDLRCSSPLACFDGLPLPTTTRTGNGVNSVDGGQTGEPLELVGHGTRDAEYAGSPGASGSNAGGGVGGAGGGSGAGGFLAASNDQPPAAGGPETPARAFLSASNGGGPAAGGSGQGSDPDPSVKYFVEELLLGDDDRDETGEGPAILALGSGGQPPSEQQGEPDGGQPSGPAFGDVLDQFPGGEEEDDYDDLAGGSDDGRNPDLNPSEVPEPANIVMVGTGLLIAAGHLRRRRRT